MQEQSDKHGWAFKFQHLLLGCSLLQVWFQLRLQIRYQVELHRLPRNVYHCHYRVYSHKIVLGGSVAIVEKDKLFQWICSLHDKKNSLRIRYRLLLPEQVVFHPYSAVLATLHCSQILLALKTSKLQAKDSYAHWVTGNYAGDVHTFPLQSRVFSGLLDNPGCLCLVSEFRDRSGWPLPDFQEQSAVDHVAALLVRKSYNKSKGE